MKTDELPGNYEIEENDQNGLAMISKGYDNAAEIHPPKTIHVIRDSGLEEYKVWGWVKVSARFLYHIRKLKGAKLAIWQVVALSIDEYGECKLSIQEIADLSGYSYSEAHESLKELEKLEYLSISKEKGRKSLYSPNFAARGQNQPNENPSRKTIGIPLQSTGEDPSSPSLENAHPSIKELKRVNAKKGDILDGLLHYGKQAKEQGEDKVEEILQEFERGLKVNIPRTTKNQSVARRILKDGRDIGKWLSWVVSDPWRAVHLYLYADLEKVWTEFPQAFESAATNPQRLDVGF